MRYLITGAAGFIGSKLAETLMSEGHTVIGVDNFNNYYDPMLKHERVLIRNIDVFEMDVGSITKMHMEDWNPDVVIHLAARAGVRDSLDYPELYHQDNIDATQNLIRVCEAAGVKKVVYASTSCVMASNKIIPWTESETPSHMLNPYGYTKFVNECQFRISKIPNTIGLRFFTVYGPWGRPDMALFKFTKAIVEGKAIDVYNYGDMKRDFTYIDDIVAGIKLMINGDIPGHEIFNIGNGKQVQLLDFIRHIEKNVGKPAVIKKLPKHPADSQETWSDTTKIQQYGYQPTVDIEEGVARFVYWYKHYYRINQ